MCKGSEAGKFAGRIKSETIVTGPRKPVGMGVSETGEAGKGQGLQGPLDHPDEGLLARVLVGSPGQVAGGFWSERS